MTAITGDKEEKKDGNSTTAAAEAATTKATVRQAHEDEDLSDVKVLNALAKDIDKLNISSSLDEDDDSLQERGPTGGIAVAPGMMMHKNIPVGPMCNYMPPPMSYGTQPNMKGSRRYMDEAEQQPNKFFRPPAEFNDFNSQMPPAFHFQNQQNFGGCFTGTNDLSQSVGQPIMSSQQYCISNKPNCMFNIDHSLTTTKMVSSSKMSGGTVQSPISSGPEIFGNNKIADGLLDEIESNPGLPVTQGNLPDFATAAGQFTTLDENLFHSKSFKEIRRPSDPDSGLDSDTGSPWSEQAPSPVGSSYTSPPSVESGCGQSPMHESQTYNGSSPPKYPGVTSPGCYRTTPSPANTSGYGSPGQPQVDDADLFDSELLDDAMAVINEDLITCEMKKSQRPMPPVPRQQQPMPPHTTANNLNGVSMMNPNQTMPNPGMVQQAPVMMPQNHMPAVTTQMLPPQPVSFPVTTSNATAPPQIIILQPQQQTSQPVIFLPVQQNPPPQPKKPGTQYKKILPKISQPSNSTSPAGGMMTTSSACKTAVTTSQTKNNRTGPQSNTQATAQNKLLMIARRTVAEIPRENLRISDDEGDTYLHIAVCKTDRYMVQALLERLHREKLESLVDKENNKRQTPLFLAAFINEPLMVAMFIRFQANVNSLAQNLSSDGMTTEVKSAIHVAASQGHEYHRTLQELLKAKDISINIVNNYGQTALHCAIMAHGKKKRNGKNRIDSTEIIRTLIKSGADPSAQDKKSGKTPLMYAIEMHSVELVDTILQTVHPDKVKNVVKTQAFDGSSCLKIAEGLKGSFDLENWNRLWNSLQMAASGSISRLQYQSQPQPVYG